MKIIVLAKQVPDTTEIKVDKATGTLIRAGVPSIINPDDLAGIEEALALKETHDAHVTVLTMGPSQAEGMLRECFGMGVDDAVLLCDGRFAGADTWATSNTLAAAIKKFDFDLIIAGRQAIDGDTAQVGPQVAEKLGIPQITYVEEIIEIHNNRLTVRKACEESSEILEVQMPCLITTLSSMNTPRYMNCIDIWEAYDKKITTLTFDDVDVTLDQVGLKASPTSVKRTFTKDVTANTKTYEVSAKEAAVMIASVLKEKQVA